MDLYELAARHRRDLERRETRAVADITRGYRSTATQVRRRLDDLADRIAARQAAGRVPVSWLFTQARLEQTVQAVDAEIQAWARGSALPRIRSAVAEEASIGPGVAMEMVQSRVVPFPKEGAASLVRLRPGEVEQLAATLQPGASLQRLLDRVAGEQADRARDLLVEAVATNRDPRRLARDLAPLVDGGLARAMTITRTELLRTTRESQRLTWGSRRQVVRGYRWWSTLDRTTCPVCFAMHGTLHDLDTPFGTHPQCRCSMIPEVAPAAELGLQLTDLPAPEMGVDVFAALPVAQQRQVLGPAKWRAYRDGRLSLEDLVRYRDDPVWGPTRSERPLRDVIGGATRPRAPRAVAPPPAVAPTTPAPELVHPRDVASVFTAKSGTKAQVLRAVERGLGAIGGLLRVPTDRPTAVKYGTPSRRALAHYRSQRGTGDPVEIMMGSRKPDLAAAFFIHEFGHYIDAAVLRPGQDYQSDAAHQAGHELHDWQAAIAATDAVQELRRVLPRGRARTYYLSARELFARSFAQWVALRSGDSALMDEVRADLDAGVPTQWTDDDFGAVADAFDTLFTGRGWRIT